MAFTKTKYDKCFMTEQNGTNKSIFEYVVDSNKYIHNDECDDYTPPFITYAPGVGVSAKSIEIENELKGINRPYTKCSECKYTNDDIDKVHINPSNKKECVNERILKLS